MDQQNDEFILKPKTPQAAIYHETVFIPKILEMLNEATLLPLVVLVCGPNLGSESPLGKKEKGDYQYSKRAGFDATTGEEVVKQLGEKDEAVHGYRKTDNVYEMIAAEASELVVILEASPDQ